jgi:mRNA-degrading endonuclease RelE of RelBE toxin-antitoxin system
MLNVDYKPIFLNKVSKIKDNSVKDQVKKKIRKVIESPEVGKPMRYARKGTREVYVGSFRLSYSYLPNEGKLVFLSLYHKDEQ